MYEKNTKDYKKSLDIFIEILKNYIDKYPQIKEILIDIEKKSPTTFNHSVNVALYTFEKLDAFKGRFREQKRNDWTLAAILHDIGKLNTPLHILHGINLSDDEFVIMMAHSIEIDNLVDKYKVDELPPECYIAMKGHHIAYESVENDFVDANKSKNPWSKYINLTEDMQIHFQGMNENDKFALELISFMDNVEAMRSNERSYKQTFSWVEIENKLLQGNENSRTFNNPVPLNPQHIRYLENESYRQHLDDLMAEKISDKVRDMLNLEYDKKKETNMKSKNDEIEME